ncbi:hypothetical protein [Larkinella harenae]
MLIKGSVLALINSFFSMLVSSEKPVAVLYQAEPPPVKDGIIKPMKPGGYADSGADIAFTLRKAAIPVIAPIQNPAATQVLDWVFPDTKNGIENALASGRSRINLPDSHFLGRLHHISCIPKFH